MTVSRQLAFALCLFWGMHTLAHAQPKHGESRGELLYATHCNACHTSKIHWREQKLAIDWSSLKAQVRRWQASIGLDWSEEEITDVTNYLNTVHYGFPVTDQQGFLPGKQLNQVLRQY
ncbi:MAG: hypothetical protein KGL01_11060 [Betaproteobacteria bacterium]|nr:hypothetical protein [Betaproteobacteria bacterium]